MKWTADAPEFADGNENNRRAFQSTLLHNTVHIASPSLSCLQIMDSHYLHWIIIYKLDSNEQN